jgi:hypothetical protein
MKQIKTQSFSCYFLVYLKTFSQLHRLKKSINGKDDNCEWWTEMNVEVAVAYFKVLSQHLPAETDINYKKSQSDTTILWAENWAWNIPNTKQER